jgi:hypothetical protein
MRVRSFLLLAAVFAGLALAGCMPVRIGATRETSSPTASASPNARGLSAGADGGLSSHTTTFGGRTVGSADPLESGKDQFLEGGRSYYVGTTVLGGLGPRPLLIVLGGIYHSGPQTEAATGWTPYGRRNNWNIVYGEGVKQSWNAGGCCGAAMANSVDDLQYLRQVVNDVEAHGNINVQAIFIAGFSNGGMMASLAVCETSSIFAAAVSVAGPLLQPSNTCKPTLALQGDRDRTVPAEGGFSSFTGSNFPSVFDVARFENSAGNDYVLRILPGLGHDWPSVIDGRAADSYMAAWLTKAAR